MEAKELPGYFLKVFSGVGIGLAKSTPGNLQFAQEASFKPVSGLSGVPNYLSFESIAHPSTYLLAQNKGIVSLIKIDSADLTPRRAHASFLVYRST